MGTIYYIRIEFSYVLSLIIVYLSVDVLYSIVVQYT
jgi:hypothetical protein